MSERRERATRPPSRGALRRGLAVALAEAETERAGEAARQRACRAATLIKYTEFPGSESDLTLQGMAMIIGYGIVMLGVCMLGCVVPTRRALNIEPTIALRTE